MYLPADGHLTGGGGDRDPLVVTGFDRLPIDLDAAGPLIPGPFDPDAGQPRRAFTDTASAFGRDNNWPIGLYHDVVFMGPDPEHAGRVLIADPDMGMERWPVDPLRYLFRGQAVMYE